MCIRNWDNSIDGSWFATIVYLPEDKLYHEVLSYMTSNGFIRKKYAFYDKEKMEWFTEQDKSIQVIAWKKLY